MAAATSNEAPAVPKRILPASARGPNAAARPSRARPTAKIAEPTAMAVGTPGSARRLIVVCAGS